MKVLAALLLLAVVVTAEYIVKTEEDLQQYRKECIAELKVPDELVQQFRKYEFPNDSITQCYLKCILVKFGLFDIESGFNVGHIHQQLQGAQHQDDALHDKITACVDDNKQGSSACEWAYRGSICFIQKNLRLITQKVKPKA